METYIKPLSEQWLKADPIELGDELRICISHGRRSTWRLLLFGFGRCTVLILSRPRFLHFRYRTVALVNNNKKEKIMVPMKRMFLNIIK